MSFYRVAHSGAATKKKKVVAKKKPKWDDSLHDLTVYKATDEEIMQRKASHKSKNHMAYKLQQMRKGQKKELASANGPLTQNQARQLAIMKEILYDQRQLKNVLDKTDSMMAVVKDLFGDDPKKYKGFPNVTTAPNAGDGKRVKNLHSAIPEIQTQVEALSDSVMNSPALNDLPDSDSDDNGDNPEPIVYQPQMNLKRFQQFIANEEKNQTLSSIGGQAQLSQNEAGPIQSTQIQGMSGFETPPPKDYGERDTVVRTPRSAINDTGKVKKTRNLCNPSADTSQQSAMNLTDMRKVLECLEDEIAEFERQTGRRHPAEKQRSDTFSGYTMALVDAVSKLARYLRETDRRLQIEIQIKEQQSQELNQMRSIIDALTSEIIATREENNKAHNDFTTYRQQTEQELAIIKAALIGMGAQNITARNLEPSSTVTPPKHHHDICNNSSNVVRSNTSVINNMEGVGMNESMCHGGFKSAIPGHVQQSGAVLLSPPVRKTRVSSDVQSHSDNQPFHSKRQTSLIDLPSLANGLSAESLYGSNPAVATVNVPRPIPLSIPNPQHSEVSQHVNKTNVSTYDHLPSQVSVSVVRNPLLPGGLPRNPREDDMKSQIAELNKQHEEAQKRLQLLLIQQQQQKVLSEQDGGQLPQVFNHPRDENNSPPMSLTNQSTLQQQRELVQQQQQIAELLDRQTRSLAHQENPRQTTMRNNDVIEQQELAMEQMQQQMRRMQQEQRNLGFDVHRVTGQVEHKQNEGPFSPPISPISQRSDNFFIPFGNNQNTRDIKISLPNVDVDSSMVDSPSPLKR